MFCTTSETEGDIFVKINFRPNWSYFPLAIEKSTCILMCPFGHIYHSPFNILKTIKAFFIILYTCTEYHEAVYRAQNNYMEGSGSATIK